MEHRKEMDCDVKDVGNVHFSSGQNIFFSRICKVISENIQWKLLMQTLLKGLSQNICFDRTIPVSFEPLHKEPDPTL